MELLSALNRYHPWNDQEKEDLKEFLRRLKCGEELFRRENTSAHITVSAWVVTPDKDRVLMAYHDLYDSWAWLGGHADGERDLLAVALQEVQEESGLIARPLSENIFSLEILPVSGHEKRGRYVSSHLHMNVTYLLEADPAAPVRSLPGENKAVGWFTPSEALTASTEPWIRDRVYKKLNEKLKHESFSG